MAKRSRAATGGSSSRSTRSTRSKASKPAASSAPVEIVEEKPGEGIDTAILVFTSVLLLGAILVADWSIGRYGEGIFFS
ncbi:MAG: hypothetical protein WD226_03165 [Planctomycetota bacterium]